MKMASVVGEATRGGIKKTTSASQTSKEGFLPQQLSSPAKGESSRAGTANVF
jgi:hypothetical protein